MYLYRLEANQLENKHAESALELLVGTKLPISQEYSSAERMSTIPSGCIRHSIVSYQNKGGDPSPLFRTGEAMSETLGPLLGLQYKRDQLILEHVQGRITKSIKRLKHL